MSLADNIEFLRRLPKMPDIKTLSGGPLAAYGWGTDQPATADGLVETSEFGNNPGDLRMFSFAPQHVDGAMPLVVVLHGCTQTAAAYDNGSGWSELADRYGFAVLLPEQTSANNGNRCFNWFNPEDTARDDGEVASIRAMIARMVQDHGINAGRIFVTGLSAGGAMTSAMLATYPDVFAGGAIIAGLPYGVAGTLQEALGAMYKAPPLPAATLGDLVRQASPPHRGSWPKISVWHGSADRTVVPGNADEIVKQWLNVHGLPPTPMSKGQVNGHPHQVWWNNDGETVVESYSITGMAHGTPLGINDNGERFGAPGPHMLEAGISSSYLIAQFFGLTNALPQTKPVPAEPPSRLVEADILPPVKAANKHETDPLPRRRVIDVNAVITRALTAAGLIK